MQNANLNAERQDVTAVPEERPGLAEIEIPLRFGRSKPLVDGYTPTRIHTGWMLIKSRVN